MLDQNDLEQHHGIDPRPPIVFTLFYDTQKGR